MYLTIREILMLSGLGLTIVAGIAGFTGLTFIGLGLFILSLMPLWLLALIGLS